jgi:O-antigen/teichoic acid export membrane protein
MALAKGAGVFFAGTLTGHGLRFVYQLVAARSLGPEAYGALLLGIALLQVMQLLADLGLSQGVVRFTAIHGGEGDRPRVKGTIRLALRTVAVSAPGLGLLMYAAARPAALGVFRSPDLLPVLRLMAVVLPVYALSTILAHAFQGLRVLHLRVIVSQIIEPGVRVALAVLFLALGGGITGILGSYLAGSLAALGAGLFFLNRVCPEVFQPSVEPVVERRRVYAYSWPMMGTFLLGNLGVWSDTLFLGFLRTPQDVGVYGAAQRTALLLTFVFGAFTAVFSPMVADLLSRGRDRELERHFQTAIHWSFALTLPLAAGLAVFAGPILGLFGRPYVRAAWPLVILAAGWTWHALAGMSGTVISMSGRSRLQLLNNIVRLIVNAGLQILFIPRWGIAGAAAATAASIVLYDAVTWIQARRILGLRPLLRDVAKPMIACGLACGASLGLKSLLGRSAPGWLALASAGALLILVYGGVTWALGVSKEDRAVLGRILSKRSRPDQIEAPDSPETEG